MKKRLFCIFALSALLIVPAVFAQTTLYTNGPVNGNGDAWNIAATYFSVSDSFTLAVPGTVNAFDFTTWTTPGDTLQSVTWALGTSSFGSDVDTGTAILGTNLSSGASTLNSFGADVENNTVTGLNDALSAGTTYWLTLSDALTQNPADSVYWDENDGPSAGYQEPPGGPSYQLPNGNPCANGAGSCTGSETFDLTSNTPEPGTLGLIGCGLLAMAGIIRRRIN